MVKSGTQTKGEARHWLHDLWLPRLVDLHEIPQARAAVGRALGMCGLDDRKGIALLPNGLPNFDWVNISKGEFIYQDGKHLTLPSFQITRYPITYAQFQVFVVASDGFYNPQWWDGLLADEVHPIHRENRLLSTVITRVNG